MTPAMRPLATGTIFATLTRLFSPAIVIILFGKALITPLIAGVIKAFRAPVRPASFNASLSAALPLLKAKGNFFPSFRVVQVISIYMRDGQNESAMNSPDVSKAWH